MSTVGAYNSRPTPTDGGGMKWHDYCLMFERDELAYPERCPSCLNLIPELIKEFIAYGHSEYLRGIREGANLLHAHADRREGEK